MEPPMDNEVHFRRVLGEWRLNIVYVVNFFQPPYDGNCKEPAPKSELDERVH